MTSPGPRKAVYGHRSSSSFMQFADDPEWVPAGLAMLADCLRDLGDGAVALEHDRDAYVAYCVREGATGPRTYYVREDATSPWRKRYMGHLPRGNR